MRRLRWSGISANGVQIDGYGRFGKERVRKLLQNRVTGNLRKLLGGHGGWDCKFRANGLEVEFKVSSCKRSISCKVGSGL